MKQLQMLLLHAAVCASSLICAADRMANRQEDEANNKTGLSANYAPEHGHGVFVTLDALVWKAYQSGLEFAVTANSSNSLLDRKAVSPCTKWKPGFRIGLGYILPKHEEWDLYAYYTEFNTNASRTIAPGSSQQLINILTNNSQVNGTSVTGASSCLRLSFKNADLELGREFFVGSLLRLRPHAGIRGAKINECYVVTYTGGLNAPDVLTFTNKFGGAGLQAGCNTEWNLFKTWCKKGQLSLYGDVSGALMVGSMKFTNNETAVNTNTYASLSNCFKDTVAVFDLALGVRWDRQFCNERLNLQLQAGWEQHWYPLLWRWIPTVVGSYMGNGNLTLSGFVFSARLDF
jgi:hypothetical protein